MTEAAKKAAPAKKTASKRSSKAGASKKTTAKKAAAKKDVEDVPQPPRADAKPVEKSGLSSVSHDDLNPAFAIKTDG